MRFKLAVLACVLCPLAFAENAELPIVSDAQGCLYADLVYREGATIKADSFQGMAKTEKPPMDMPRLKCFKRTDNNAFYWEPLDKLTYKGLEKAPGYDAFIEDKPIGRVK